MAQPDNPLSSLEAWLRNIIREEIKAAQVQNRDGKGQKLFNAKRAAEYLDLKDSKVREMARRGELPCIRLGYYVKFNPDDLDKFITENRK